MNKLSNVRLRHSALNALRQHMNTYLECMELEYYGQRTEEERQLCLRLKESLQLMQHICWNYFDEEGRIMECNEV